MAGIALVATLVFGSALPFLLLLLGITLHILLTSLAVEVSFLQYFVLLLALFAGPFAAFLLSELLRVFAVSEGAKNLPLGTLAAVFTLYLGIESTAWQSVFEGALDSLWSAKGVLFAGFLQLYSDAVLVATGLAFLIILSQVLIEAGLAWLLSLTALNYTKGSLSISSLHLPLAIFVVVTFFDLIVQIFSKTFLM